MIEDFRDELLRLPRLLVLGLVSALLPSPERDRFAARHDVEPPRWSLAVGAVQLVVGTWLFLSLGFAFMTGATTIGNLLLLENWSPELSSAHVSGMGLVNWLAWLVLPFSWPFSYLALTGAIRVIAFVATREAVGEPVLVLPFWVARAAARRMRRRREEALLGPLRPDRVLREESGDLVVISCREKEGWDEAATIDISGWYYAIVAVERRRDGEWTAFAYRLRERKAVDAIRRLVPYTPPRRDSSRR